MKRLFWVALLGVVFIACSNADDNRGESVTLDFEGEYWDSLVDNPQYMGELLYSGNGYGWYDEATGLASELTDAYADKKFWGGGVAISSYFTTDHTTANTAPQQLTILAEGAHSGKNCAVCHGYNLYGDCRSYIYFKSQPRKIESAWVAHTAYSYAMAKDGELGTYPIPALTNESVWIHAIGYTLDKEGNEVEGASLDFYLYKDGECSFDGWKLWDMSPLGVVYKVRFDVQWNGNGPFPHPAYFALDDITVRVE
ncbi:MAG: DUF4465 domain-containing protein [Alistipes sp.]|nr:DUF4465 domain-containing protein [Alistipes sp.]